MISVTNAPKTITSAEAIQISCRTTRAWARSSSQGHHSPAWMRSLRQGDTLCSAIADWRAWTRGAVSWAVGVGAGHPFRRSTAGNNRSASSDDAMSSIKLARPFGLFTERVAEVRCCFSIICIFHCPSGTFQLIFPFSGSITFVLPSVELVATAQIVFSFTCFIVPSSSRLSIFIILILSLLVIFP